VPEPSCPAFIGVLSASDTLPFWAKTFLATSTTYISAQGRKEGDSTPYCPNIYILPSWEKPKSTKTAESPAHRAETDVKRRIMSINTVFFNNIEFPLILIIGILFSVLR